MSAEPTSTTDAREARLAHNEVIFRGVNEAIEQQAIEFGTLDDYEFICECSSTACVDRITLTISDYESVRRVGTRFFVARGHEDIEVELVVETRPNFLIVEKDGAAGAIAVLEDPRAGDAS